jgi:flagellar basal-body rod protein FlgG
MEAQQLNIDVISNNLANVNTTGFKKSRVDFQDLLYQTTRSATGIQIGLGTRAAATQKIFTQGDYQETGNPLDIVIQGDGFFQVQLPDGSSAYTRDGTFKMDSQGRIVTSDGFPLAQQLTIPAEATSVSIGSDGTVTVEMPGQTAPQDVGQIQIAKFPNPAGLDNYGRNLLIPTAASGDAQLDAPGTNGLGSLANKFVEMSNVKVVEEMVNMIVAQRAYEVNSKAIQTSDEMLTIANNLRR